MVDLFRKYEANVGKVVTACKKALNLVKERHISVVADVLGLDGNTDFHLTHEKFQLRQVENAFTL